MCHRFRLQHPYPVMIGVFLFNDSLLLVSDGNKIKHDYAFQLQYKGYEGL